MIEDRIRQRIAQLASEREQFVLHATRTVGGFDAAIGELEALLVPDTEEAPESEDGGAA